ncbi:MAG TPA: MFS transporter [Naasia sp.]|jgi:predicted MFS family arabinose efflux permease
MTQAPGRFPALGLSVLAGAIFVSVTGEFLPTGLLPDMAADLDVSLSRTGILVTVFAATVVIATTPLTVLTRHVSRKALVILVLLVNAAATVLAALAPSYEFLLGARILAGLAHGLFWACVGSYATNLVPREQLTRAIAITGAGGSAAFVLGVPVGTLVGHAVGWRLAFVAIAVTMVILAALVVRFLPAVEHRVPVRTGEIPLPLHKDRSLPTVLLVCSVIAVVLTGQNVIYTYIAPFIAEAGFGEAGVGPILFLYGGAGAVGLFLAGSLGSRRPRATLLGSMAVVVLSIVLLGALPASPVPTVALVLAWGTFFGVIPPLLQTRNLGAATPRMRDLASATMTTAFNAGIGGGALLGGVLLDSWGLRALPWAAAAIIAAGALILLPGLIERPRKASGPSVMV